MDRAQRKRNRPVSKGKGKKNSKGDSDREKQIYDVLIKDYEGRYKKHRDRVESINNEGLRNETSAKFWIENRYATYKGGALSKVVFTDPKDLVKIKNANGTGHTAYISKENNLKMFLGIKTKEGIWLTGPDAERKLRGKN